MIRSSFLRRVLALVLTGIVLFALIATLLYSALSRNMFQMIGVAELRPKSERILAMCRKYPPNEISDGMISMLIEIGPDVIGAYVLLVDDEGRILANNAVPDGTDVQAYFGGQLNKVLSGDEAIFSGKTPSSRLDVLVLGVPVKNEMDDITGALFLFKPQLEIVAALSGMNSSLILSMLLVTLATIPMAYAAARMLARPLQQMKNVASEMAKGNFTARADDTQKDEFSQLGRTLNHLAKELSQSISELTVERNRLMQILNGISEGIVAVDTQCRVTHFNPAMRRLFGSDPTTPANSASPDPRLDIVPNAEIWHDFESAIADNCPITRSLTLPDKVLRVTIAPIADEARNIVGAVGLFRDITESERLEQTRRDYVANVSHEMRTPLTALRGLIEPLRDGIVRDDAARARYYDIMMRETMRLSRLINDLMELSRLQSGQLALKQEPTRIDLLLSDISDKYHAQADEADLTFTLERPETLPPVLGNADRIEQVLVILLDNAMKYTDEGGSVKLLAEVMPETVSLKVRDTGLGISPQDLPFIFDRFYKVDKAHSGLGSGLGLSIAQEIVSRMGQKLTVQSTVGVGTEFTFMLNRADTNGAAHALSATSRGSNT